MAKKKATTPAAEESPEDVVDRMVDSVTKKYGNVVCKGNEYVDKEVKSIALSPSFSTLMNGPFQEGSIIGLTGNEKTGKTITALSFAAQAQAQGRQIIYGLAESRASQEHLRAVRGIDWEKVIIVQSTQEKILSAQEELDIYLQLLKNIPGCCLIIDSISGMVHQTQLNEGFEKELRGGMAKLFSQFIAQARKYVTVNDSYLIGITHLICDTGNPMAGKQEKVARAWKYMCDYQLRAISSTYWKDSNEDVIGLQVSWLNKTSRNSGGPPGGKSETYLRFGIGVDGLYELLKYAETIKMPGTSDKMFGRAGAWFSCNWMKKYPDLLGIEAWDDKKHEKLIKKQGAQAIYDMVTERPEWVEALKTELTPYLGMI